MPNRHPNVINLNELPVEPATGQGRLKSIDIGFAYQVGARQLGASMYTVAPGNAAFPHHWHSNNEEAILILEGTGSLRIGEDTVEVGPGDWASFPVGQEFAHQLLNSGTGPLRYICISTTKTPELCGYPDSKKVAAFWRPEGAEGFRGVFSEEDRRGYYDQEPMADEEK